MQLSIQVNANSNSTLHDQLVGEISTSITSGRLKAGTRLPGTRALGDQLGVSRNTVLLAFATLVAEGFLETREGSGTYVSEVAPEPVAFEPPPVSLPSPRRRKAAKRDDAPHTDFKLEGVDSELFPRPSWRRLMMRRMQSSEFNPSKASDARGLVELRQALCRFLGVSRGMVIDPDQIIVVSSIQRATDVVSMMLIERGTPVVVEGPGCSLIPPICERAGATILRVPVDREGMRVDKLPYAKRALAAVTPARQYPMGVIMPTDRRQMLLEWAETSDSHVLEVDFDSDFFYSGSPLPSLQAQDRNGRFIYCGSFALTIGPGLRIGYLVVPLHMVEPARDALEKIDHANSSQGQGAPWLDQAVLADFMESGGYEKQLRRLRRTYMQRRDALLDRLDYRFGRCDLLGTTSGTHVVWRLPDRLPDARTCRTLAMAAGVTVYTMELDSITGTDTMPDADRHLLLGYAELQPSDITQAVDRFAALVN